MPIAKYLLFSTRLYCRKPLHQWLFYLLLLLLPIQLGKHFWFDFSLVRGIRIDYLSPTVYLTDIIVLGILLSWWRQRWINGSREKFSIFLLLLLATSYILLNTLFSTNPLLTLYKWIKLVELALLGYYVYRNARLFTYVIYLLGITVIYSSLLAWAQFLNQSSIGGLFWWLGERTFSLNTPGIAAIPIDGRLYLRPYATFPHPNVLAGYLLLVLTFIFYQRHPDSSARAALAKTLILSTGAVTLILTFSSAAWLTAGMIFGALVIKGRRGIREMVIGTALFAGLLVYWFSGLVVHEVESITIRHHLNTAAMRMILSSPIFGVGLGNFVSLVPQFLSLPTTISYLQPVHNIFLLIAAETGLVGLGFFFWFLIRTILSIVNRQSSVILLFVILLLGLVDHYFITLQQTQLLLAIVIGLIYGKKTA